MSAAGIGVYSETSGTWALREKLRFDLYLARDNRVVHAREDSWGTVTDLPADYPGTVVRSQSDASSFAIIETEGLLVTVTVDQDDRTASVAAWGYDEGAVVGAIAALRETLPPVEVDLEAPTVPVRFWVMTPNGPSATVREVSAPRWSAIEGNYPGPTRRALDSLVATRRPEPAASGQLMIWHGMPGTREWLAAHDRPTATTRDEMSLADLYEAARPEDGQRVLSLVPKAAVGFGR